jgi:hypothetical protein
MDGYQLTASVIQSVVSLAWPAAIVFSVWLFREKLKELLPLFRIKHREWEASFRLEKAEKEAAALPRGSIAGEPTPEEKTRFEQIADVSPQAAITEIRRELQDALSTLADRQGFPGKQLTMLGLMRLLRNKGIIDAQTSALLDDLRAIGNQAAHGGPEVQFTKDDAMRVRALADQVIGQIEGAKGS